MSEVFKVLQGVPLPEIDRAPKGTRRKYPIATMAVGDMFFVPHRRSKSVSAYISRISKGVPGKFTARHAFMRPTKGSWELTSEDDPKAVEGTGVWRLE